MSTTVDIKLRNLAELERRAAMYGPGEAPLFLLNQIAELEEEIAMEQERAAAAAVPAADVRRQLYEARANLALIQERKSEYVQATDIPLQLIKDERRWQARIAELEARLSRLEAQTAAPGTLRLFIAAPDGTRYETVVEADLLVAQLQAAFLDGWTPPPDALARYTLRRRPDDLPLEAAQTLAEAGIAAGDTLHLAAEPLQPASAVGLTIEDAAGSRYVTAVRLDTPVDVLAREFLRSTGQQGRPQVELLNGPAESHRYRPLRDTATLYDERVNDGARLRIAASG